jgi:hypothetical protein
MMLTSLLQIGLTTAAVAVLIAGTGPVVRWVRRRVERRRAASRPDPRRRPIQVVAADLRRLTRQLSLVPTGAPMVRRRALQAAYDDVLGEAADLLELPHELRTLPEGRGRDLERLRVLGAVRQAGLAVPG